MWVGYIEFDDETGEAIAADYSGLEVTVEHGLEFSSNYKFRGDWNSDMKFVTDCREMFDSCSNLTSFTGDLSSLTISTNMFSGCSNLTSFNGDLSSLTYGENMFSGCSNLTSFTGDLSSLTYGLNMFGGCKLDKESIIKIITCIRERNTFSSTSTVPLTIGCDKKYQNDPELLGVLGISSWQSSVTIVGHGGCPWTIVLQAN